MRVTAERIVVQMPAVVRRDDTREVNAFTSRTDEWRPVAGFEGYEVSALGLVRSHNRARVIVMSPAHGRNGHQHVCLYPSRGSKQRLTRMVYRLVLEAFVGPCPDGMEACHYDGDTSNNRLENLRWDTHAGNCRDMVRLGRSGRGRGRRKLTDEQAREIVESPESNKVVAHRYGVSPSAVSMIRSGMRWARVR